MLEAENQDAETPNELRRIYQFVEQNKNFVLDQFTAYREKVKVIEILHLKLLNHKSAFKHELKLGILTLDQYELKVIQLNKKLNELKLKRDSMKALFLRTAFNGVSESLTPEDIISYLHKILA